MLSVIRLNKNSKWVLCLMIFCLALFALGHLFLISPRQSIWEKVEKSDYLPKRSLPKPTTNRGSLIMPSLPYSIDDFVVRKQGPNTGKLPSLAELAFPQYEMRPEQINVKLAPERASRFEVPLSHTEKQHIDRLLSHFLNMLYVNRLGDCIIMIAGTLLGSFRHHNSVPWDDDFDLGMNVTCEEQVIKLMTNANKTKILPENIAWTQMKGRKLKLYFSDVGRNLTEYSWNWPYLDILYFESNSTHMTEIPESYSRKFVYPLGEIYPILYRPFGRFWLPAPSHLMAHFKYDFEDGEICSVFGYSHILEDGQHSNSTKCVNLSTRYAFVRRERPTFGLDQHMGESWRKQNIVWINESLVIAEQIPSNKDNHNSTLEKTFHSLIIPGHVSTLLSTDPYSFNVKL